MPRIIIPPGVLAKADIVSHILFGKPPLPDFISIDEVSSLIAFNEFIISFNSSSIILSPDIFY